ncbi:hypothetical protein [Candidatus Berkiella aquae]|uniref:Uncharacterized protein n=1 Tax=Candidatus Berkiella aquae TaxID=295108 RepID=A0A0Q9YH55_9GAMM|nr:hypothetical protein [Candidatus Berkiella aquae]MCS5711629.1 hypothetical protein [Candidatus Berkiella aquae]
MTQLIHQLQDFYSALLEHQPTVLALQNETETALFQELLTSIAAATKDKQTDWQVTYQQLINIKSRCCPFYDASLTSLVVEKIHPYCEKIICERRTQIAFLLNFIHDYKAVKNKSAYDKTFCDDMRYLQYLFDSSEILPVISQLTLEEICTKIKDSKTFSESEILIWLRTTQKHDERVFKEMLSSQQVVKRKYFPAGEYTISPLIQERFNRQRRYNRLALLSTSDDVINTETFSTESKLVLSMMKLTKINDEQLNTSTFPVQTKESVTRLKQ